MPNMSINTREHNLKLQNLIKKAVVEALEEATDGEFIVTMQGSEILVSPLSPVGSKLRLVLNCQLTPKG